MDTCQRSSCLCYQASSSKRAKAEGHIALAPLDNKHSQHRAAWRAFFLRAWLWGTRCLSSETSYQAFVSICACDEPTPRPLSGLPNGKQHAPFPRPCLLCIVRRGHCCIPNRILWLLCYHEIREGDNAWRKLWQMVCVCSSLRPSLKLELLHARVGSPEWFVLTYWLTPN